jgi:hypothetical protein
MSAQNYERSTAVRTFSAELEVANHLFKESDEDTAPEYLLLPSGEKANRVLIGGTVAQTEQLGDSTSRIHKMEVEDGTGERSLSVQAGKFNKKAAAQIDSITAPEHVIVVGKIDTYEPEPDTTIVSVRAEGVKVVDRDELELWMETTVRQSLSRLEDIDSDYSRKAYDLYDDPPGILQDDLMTVLEELE